VRANTARTASGTQQSLTGRLTSTARHTAFVPAIQPRDVNWKAELKTSQFVGLRAVSPSQAKLLLSDIPAASAVVGRGRPEGAMHLGLARPGLHPSVHRIPENFNAIGRQPRG